MIRDLTFLYRFPFELNCDRNRYYESASKVQACFLTVALTGLAAGMIKIGFAFRSLSKAIGLKDL